MTDPGDPYAWTQSRIDSSRGIWDFTKMALSAINNAEVTHQIQNAVTNLGPTIQGLMAQNPNKGVLVEVPFYRNFENNTRQFYPPLVLGVGDTPDSVYCKSMQSGGIVLQPPNASTNNFSEADFIWYAPNAAPTTFQWLVPPHCGDDWAIYPDGSSYIGSTTNQKPDGYGEMIWHGQGRYVGFFSNCQLNGNGDIGLGNGDHYTGHFDHGQMQGNGIYESAFATYNGNFANNVPSGAGTLTLHFSLVTVSGNFRGSFFDGDVKIHYPATTHLLSADATGTVVHGLFEGPTTWKISNGCEIDGPMQHGQWMPGGTIHFSNGTSAQWPQPNFQIPVMVPNTMVGPGTPVTIGPGPGVLTITPH